MPSLAGNSRQSSAIRVDLKRSALHDREERGRGDKGRLPRHADTPREQKYQRGEELCGDSVDPDMDAERLEDTAPR